MLMFSHIAAGCRLTKHVYLSHMYPVFCSLVLRVFLLIHRFNCSKFAVYLVIRTKEREKGDGWSVSISIHEILFPYPVITELELQDISVTSDLLHKP